MPASGLDQLLGLPLPTSLAAARKTLKERIFKDCSDIVFRDVVIGGQTEGLLLFTVGMVDADRIDEALLRPLLFHLRQAESPETLATSGQAVAAVATGKKYGDAVKAVLDGKAALLVDGYASSLILHVKGGKRRSVQEPPSEVAVRGPREGFVEEITANLSLLRFKIRTPQLKMVEMYVGKETRTRVVLAYLETVADQKVLAEVKQRLERIEIDGVLESGYIESFIEDEPWSPFPQVLYSERPDTVAAQLLEGRFAIFTDGSPFVIMGPVSFWQTFQASEDYYERFMIGSMLRVLRFAFAGVALFLPAIYIAVITFHQDMLPTSLMLSIASSREAIPFPALVEGLMMEVSFEGLREAGIRLPKTVGQAVSILGALVIGQAAVEAGIVSAPMVIIVSLTGIASFTVPHFNAAISLRMLRFPLMALAGAFGLVGIVLGATWIGIHLCSLRSFGVPYTSGVAPFKPEEAKDILVRAPWWQMVLRPSTIPVRNRRRTGRGQKPQAPTTQR